MEKKKASPHCLDQIWLAENTAMEGRLLHLEMKHTSTSRSPKQERVAQAPYCTNITPNALLSSPNLGTTMPWITVACYINARTETERFAVL